MNSLNKKRACKDGNFGRVKISENEEDAKAKDPEAAWKNGISSEVIKRCIEAMSRNIDNMNRKSAQFYHKLMTKRVIEEIREEELKKVIEVLRNIDQAPEQLYQVIGYRMKEKNEETLAAAEVAKEYHMGKFDPKLVARNNKKKKK